MVQKELANIARKVAAEGMVLLENKENVLPLCKDEKIALIGNGCFHYLKGGWGSAEVTSEYVVDLVGGLKERNAFVVNTSLSKQDAYDVATCNRFSEECDCALISFVRDSGEGSDRWVGYYDLSKEEIELLETLEKSNFKKVIVILNVASVINVASIAKYSKVKAVLAAWLPGMEGGNAICDVLYGDITPSGKLTDTIAYQYTDYPSASTFNTSPMYVHYAEDIFVGYRYFETFAKEKVAYPFGCGLSYTKFTIENISYTLEDEKINVELTVKNVGDYAGREVVQVYSSSPKTEVVKPAVELRGYKKTKLLQPNESENIVISFAVNDMAYFDEKQAAYALDKGVYQILVGNSVRNLTVCGQYEQSEKTSVYQTALKFSFGTPYKINENGEFEKTLFWNQVKERNPFAVRTAGDEGDVLRTTCCSNDYKTEQENTEYSLYDVANGTITLDELIKNMTSAQLIEMAMGQPPALVRGTAGIGNIPSLKIPNPQTADGPAGIRSTKPTLCFPCATLFAATWNAEVLEEVGAAIGEDAIHNGVDILLAPGLNIHRNPLCGRNFEYYSEDPVVSGKCAAAVVRGVQSKGVGATIKHFAFNNKEENRHESISIISERAIREIYLKGFQIAIKEGAPWCVMTSYNLVNGVRTAAHVGLIKGILREEWNYDGLVMTDWRVHSHLWEDIKAGSNVKMPCGYPEEIQLAKDYYSWNLITRKELEECAKYILNVVMKTRRFKEEDFGKTQKIGEFNVLDFICLSTTWSGTCKEEDGTVSLTHIGLDNRGQESFVDYRVENECEGEFVLQINASCIHEGQYVDIFIDGEKATKIAFVAPEYDIKKFFTYKSTPFKLSVGIHEIRSMIRGTTTQDSVHYKEWKFIKQ